MKPKELAGNSLSSSGKGSSIFYRRRRNLRRSKEKFLPLIFIGLKQDRASNSQITGQEGVLFFESSFNERKKGRI